MQFVNSAREKVGEFFQRRKEQAAIRKMERQAKLQTEHGHGRFFLLHIPATATVFAAFVEVYWALLFCIEATGQLVGHFDMAAAWNAPWRFVWDLAFSGNAFVLIGLLAATAPIVMISMVWLPVQFAMRGFGRWRRGTLIAVGLLANAIVILSGTVVMNANRQEQVRAGLVTEQRGDAGRAALVARRDAVEQRWRTLTEPSNTTLQAQAARAGVAGWDAYIQTARQQSQDGTISAGRLALIERARGSAVAAEQYQQQMDQLTGDIAEAAPAAATAAHVEDATGASLNNFAEQVKVWRPPLIAIGCTLIGILGAWWTLAMLLHMNPRDVLRSGWADEAHRIEDHSDEEKLPVDSAGMRPPREVVTDAESGEELIKITPKPHWRKRKGKPQSVEIRPDIPPDERGAPEDGGGRIGSVELKGPLSVDGAEDVGDRVSEEREIPRDAVNEERQEYHGDRSEQRDEEPQPEQPEPPEEPSPEEYLAASEATNETLETPPTDTSQEPQEERPEDDRSEQDDDGDQHDELRQPIVDESRLLPAK